MLNKSSVGRLMTGTGQLGRSSVWSLIEVLWVVDSSIWKLGSEISGGGSIVASCTGKTGSLSGSGWIKTGGEMLERVNGKFVSLFAVCHIISYNPINGTFMGNKLTLIMQKF